MQKILSIFDWACWPAPPGCTKYSVSCQTSALVKLKPKRIKSCRQALKMQHNRNVTCLSLQCKRLYIGSTWFNLVQTYIDPNDKTCSTRDVQSTFCKEQELQNQQKQIPSKQKPEHWEPEHHLKIDTWAVRNAQNQLRVSTQSISIQSLP